MKKSFFIGSFISFLIIILSFQSTKISERKTLPLDFSENGGKTLDSYWNSYFNTKGVLSSNFDMDFLSVYLLKYADNENSNKMKYIYSLFPQDLLVRNAVKTSAFCLYIQIKDGKNCEGEN